MLDFEEAKEFMKKPLPERFHIYMISEMCDEDGYNEMMKNNNYNYLPILQQIKEKLPAEFFAYFNDLLIEEEYDKYFDAFKKALGGMV
ncbi:hypothetical protein C7Y71_009800 [Pseudoprevotella muciniphila]|uniref:Uncharacterized protein n=1 Tax=Pseudoprevotella muciniphila TaxID=2133944 RepID=A0A5P8E8C3_9BACT|nr:hypothetical protein [Pseudoprevotella muciniphila]QFQ13275.1 hypothetical protein C7Y71_009800 [Pseudoprevotella muciniphila]